MTEDEKIKWMAEASPYDSFPFRDNSLGEVIPMLARKILEQERVINVIVDWIADHDL